MHPNRSCMSAAVCLFLTTVPATAKPTTVTAEVNLREQPNTTSTALALIPKGDSVDVLKCADGWCQVTWDGRQGYVISRNLGMPQPRPAVRRAPPPQVYAGPPVYSAPPIYVGPPPGYYGYYGYGPYFGPRLGFGWGRRRW